MFDQPPPDPPPERPTEREPLGFDDFIGILVAFATIGTILWWSFGRIQGGKIGIPLSTLSPSPTPSPFVLDRGGERPVGGARILPPAPSRTIPVPEPQPSPTPVGNVVPVPSGVRSSSSDAMADLPPGYWASPCIVVVVRRGILHDLPDGTFGPGRAVTRAEFARMVGDAFERSRTRGPLDFRDLPKGDEVTSAVDEAVGMEFMKGYPGTVFRPDRPITKVEALVTLANGLRLPRPASSEGVSRLFRDAGDIPPYALEAVAAATSAGLVVNYPDPALLAPKREITRAEAAALIHQALASSGKVERISSPYIARPRRVN